MSLVLYRLTLVQVEVLTHLKLSCASRAAGCCHPWLDLLLLKMLLLQLLLMLLYVLLLLLLMMMMLIMRVGRGHLMMTTANGCGCRRGRHLGKFFVYKILLGGRCEEPDLKGQLGVISQARHVHV